MSGFILYFKHSVTQEPLSLNHGEKKISYDEIKLNFIREWD